MRLSPAGRSLDLQPRCSLHIIGACYYRARAAEPKIPQGGRVPISKASSLQALVAELAVEAFGNAILPRIAGLDQRRADALRDDPGQQRLGHELRSVVAAQEGRGAAGAHQAGQHLDDTGGANAAVDIDGQTFLGELVRDGQALELLAVGAMIEHEVLGPHLVRPARRTCGRGRRAAMRFLGR
jgi:hypothetical protein